MRLTATQQSARPTYYDRNPIMRTSTVNTGVIGPHAATTRWTYTVPANKKAFVEALLTFIWRVTVAAPWSPAQNYIYFTPSGGSQTIVTLTQETQNVANLNWAQYATQFGYMSAGDAILNSTGDVSTGGTAAYVATMKGVEFDA